VTSGSDGTACVWLALAGLLAIFWSQWIWVKPTNFGGFDEWGVVWMMSRGFIDAPHVNRPFTFLWTWPSAIFAPYSLLGFSALHVVYLCLSGWTVYFLCTRLAPGNPIRAFLAATFALVWAPMDSARLMAVWGSAYSGLTFGTLLTIALFVESWIRGRSILFVAGGLLAFVHARTYEAPLALLLGAPLLLAWLPRRGPRRLLLWIVLWEAFVAIALALTLSPLMQEQRGWSYQASSLDLDAGNVLMRLLTHYRAHLLPLVMVDFRELAEPAVGLAVAVFVATCWLVWPREAALEIDRRATRTDAGLLLLGLVLAGLGYGAYALSTMITTSDRTQFFSAFGIGLLLASAFHLMTGFLPRPARRGALVLLGTWVVAVGAGRTVAMQRDWDVRSAFETQRNVLAGLTTLAPDLRPHTLVVLIDQARAFPASFAFRYGVEYLYQGRASGHVLARWDERPSASSTRRSSPPMESGASRGPRSRSRGVRCPHSTASTR
jgi:hypothetical protein